MATFSTLIVCEKPTSASKVAQAIDEEGSPGKKYSNGVPFYECSTRQGPVTVCSAIGHLYEVETKGTILRSMYPVWDLEWQPRKSTRQRSNNLAKWISVIGSLAARADRFVNACDYDVEGSLIGLTVLRYACSGADTKALRMKFSTMTTGELQSSYGRLSTRLDFSLAEAGRCRHELDWFYGVNLSRALTQSALQENRGYATLSTGRVQGPTLSFVVSREMEIESFVPIPFWIIDARIVRAGVEYPLEYSEGRVSTLAQADRIVQDCNGEELTVENIESEESQLYPPFPFDLSTLQAEAYRHFHYSPSRTLAIAERLYLDALISYPRTSSQKLPPDIDYQGILERLARRSEYSNSIVTLFKAGRLFPNQGPKDDPAHPAIYPTGERFSGSLAGAEGRVYDLIVRRFAATFGKPSVSLVSKMILRLGSHVFFIRGVKTVTPGWRELYGAYSQEKLSELPTLEVVARIPMDNIRAVENFEKPPSRYNPSSLLREMEKANIGTKATRAQILDTLFERGYVEGSMIRATPLAVQVTKTLHDHCPVILRSGMTAHFEEYLDEVQNGKRSRRLVLLEALESIRSAMLGLMGSEEEVGTGLSEVVLAQKTAKTTLDAPCPDCGSPLRIVRNKQSGKRFIGCTGKWTKKCGFALPLPQFGTISLLSRRCKVCGFQLISVRSRRRRAIESCPRCYAAKARDRESKSTSEHQARKLTITKPPLT